MQELTEWMQTCKNTDVRPTLPTITIATPTFNRRPFISFLFEVVKQQTYPHDKMEWIIIDDGTDCVEDIITAEIKKNKNNGDKSGGGSGGGITLFDNILTRYVRLEKKHTLGEKRNMLRTMAEGDIIVNFDDDDYYFPERIAHGVHMLLKNPDYICAGSSAMYMYFTHEKKCKLWGPLPNRNHSTAAPLIFWRQQMSQMTAFLNTDNVGEEKAFLHNYNIPLLQLQPELTILVIAHSQNSSDKHELKKENNCTYLHDTKETLQSLVKNTYAQTFIKNVGKTLDAYASGNLSYKPDVIQEITNKKIHLLEKQMSKCTSYINMLEMKIQGLEIRINLQDNKIRTLETKN